MKKKQRWYIEWMFQVNHASSVFFPRTFNQETHLQGCCIEQYRETHATLLFRATRKPQWLQVSCVYIYIHVYNMLQVISSTWSCIKHLVKKQIFKERIGILEGTTHRIRNDLLSDLKSWLPPKKKNMCKPYNTFYFSALFSVFQACLLDTH